MVALLWPVATSLRICFQDVPVFVCTRIPGVSLLICAASFYMFAQAMALVLIFGNSLLAALCTKVVAFLVGDGVTRQGAGEVLEQPLRALVWAYNYYSVFRVLFLFGWSMWTAMWEIAYDFPTIRHAMIGGRRRVSDNDKETQTEAADLKGNNGEKAIAPDDPKVMSPTVSMKQIMSVIRASKKWQVALKQTRMERKFHQVVLVVAPWTALICLLSIMLGARGYCTGWLGGAGQDFGCAFFDPAARMNRNLRLVIFLFATQLLQGWRAIYPEWHVALSRAPWGVKKVLCLASLQLLAPLAFARIGVWLLSPSGVLQQVIGLPHFAPDTFYLFDCLLTIWGGVWLILATFVIVSPEAIDHSGYLLHNLADDAAWGQLCANFRYMLWFWQIVQGVRGTVALGPAHATSDLVTINVLYPLLFCLTWTVTFITFKVSNYVRSGRSALACVLGCVATGVATYVLCTWGQFEGEGVLPVLMTFVWLHLCGEGLRIFRAWSLWARSVQEARTPHHPQLSKQSRAKSVKFAVDPAKARGMSMANARQFELERKLGLTFVRILLIAAFAFSSMLVVCVLIGGVQHRQGWTVGDVVWWRALPGGSGFELTNAGASVLTLTTANGSAPSTAQSGSSDTKVLMPPRVPEYMVCNQAWHGLQVVDFALLAELPYMRPLPENDLPGLLGVMAPHLDLKITKASSGRRPWTELELTSPTGRVVKVVAVSGTMVDRVVDYLENIRMWTEPVVLQLLATFFPLTRVWPRETTSLYIGSMHRMMASVGVHDNQWHYKEVLDYVRQIPEEQEVVVTGHSLGGGIALVVGALTSRTAVAIQPPGIYFSLAKHQAIQHDSAHQIEESHALHRKSMSLVVEGDWIQHFDNHGGLVQTLTCDQAGKSLAVGCHLLEGSICHLLRHCGDQARRFTTCTHNYSPTKTTVSVVRTITQFVRLSYLLDTSRLWNFFISKGFVKSWCAAGVAVAVVAVVGYGAPRYRHRHGSGASHPPGGSGS